MQIEKLTGTVRVNRKAADRAASGHPWIFSSDITDRGESEPGGVVRVLDQRGQSLGVAHYSSTSQIALRLLSGKPEPIDRAFFLRRITQAIAHRERLVENSTAFRLVFSEADLLPGLIVDKYGPYVVLQTLDQGMDRVRDLIADCLTELLRPAGILARNDASVRRLEGLPLETVVLAGEIPERVPIEMNGLRLDADLLHGQKTGVYLDQRENYLAAARYARGRVLDCFTSTGGFALHLARSAQSVEALDSSAPALATAEANARTNGIDNVQFRQADVFDFLSGIGRHYSTDRSGPARFRQIPQANRRRRARLQGDQPAGSAAAGPRRNSGDLLLLASRERSDAAGDCR